MVHAGKKIDRQGYEWVRATFPHIPLPALNELAVGGYVGYARMVDCVSADNSPWFFGDFGFKLEGGQPMEFSAAKGRLGFFQAD